MKSFAFFTATLSFATLFAASYSQAALEPNSVRAWTKPNWGFSSQPELKKPSTKQAAEVQKKPAASPGEAAKELSKLEATRQKLSSLSNSLIFDQNFDQKSYRPIPESLSQALETLVAAKKVKAVTVASNKVSQPQKEDSINKVVERSSAWSRLSQEIATQPQVDENKKAFEDFLAQKDNKVAAAKVKKVVEAKPDTKKPEPAKVAKTEETVKKAEKADKKKPAIFKRPEAHKEQALIAVLDEESLGSDQLRPVAHAEIVWVGLGANLKSKTNSNGVARSPYPNTLSMRFFVKAEGYLPAIGYAIEGHVTPVALVREQRLPAILKSLKVVPDPNKTMLLGKVLSKEWKPVENISIDATFDKPFELFYSLGSLGLFHPAAKKTGSFGDFFISGLSHSLQYLMPTQNLSPLGQFKPDETQEWPAALVNLEGAGSIVTHTTESGASEKLETMVVDAFSLERPEGVGIQSTIGGQRGVFIPDEFGNLVFPELYARSSVDLVEIRAKSYLTTWVNAHASAARMPEHIALFSQRQIDEIFADLLPEIRYHSGIVFGNLRLEDYTRPVRVEVFNSRGKKHDARVVYFDQDNRVNLRQERTHLSNQNFAILNLPQGEWQVMIIDPESGHGMAAQVLRVNDQTVTQVQF